MSANAKFIAATAGILLMGFIGYFIVPSVLQNVGKSRPALDAPSRTAAAVVSNVPSVDALPPLDEPLPAASSSKTIHLGSARLLGAGVHAASGSVMLLSIASTSFVRIEGLGEDNGPDLHVYLSKDLNAGGASIDLGAIKTTSGNVNYSVPVAVTAGEYPYLITWSNSYGVLFNYANLK